MSNYGEPKDKRKVRYTEEYLKMYFGGDKVELSGTQDDKNGTDYWVTNEQGLSVAVDVKYCNLDFKGEILLESHHEFKNGERKDGWSKLPKKNTDYIVYVYNNNFAIPLAYNQLRHAYTDHYDVICRDYPLKSTDDGNNGYYTFFNIVPVKYIFDLIYLDSVKSWVNPNPITQKEVDDILAKELKEELGL